MRFLPPSVKEYLEEKNLPLKVLLVMDNAPAHHQGLEEDLSAEYGFIQVKFCLPTPLLSSNPFSKLSLISRSCT
jgi:hypothetical protein